MQLRSGTVDPCRASGESHADRDSCRQYYGLQTHCERSSIRNVLLAGESHSGRGDGSGIGRAYTYALCSCYECALGSGGAYRSNREYASLGFKFEVDVQLGWGHPDYESWTDDSGDTMSQPWTIQLSRGRLVALAACLVASVSLVFLAGTATGLLVASRSADVPAINSKGLKAETSRPTSKAESSGEGSEQEPTPRPGDTDQASVEVPGSGSVGVDPNSNGTSLAQAGQAPPSSLPAVKNTPATAPLPSVVPSSDLGNKGGTDAKPASVPTASSSLDEGDKVPLAVKVCSFSNKSSAEKMVASLAEHGYQASLAHSVGADGRAWYVVKLGPYSEWDTASTVAAQVAIAENVRPVVGPIK